MESLKTVGVLTQLNSIKLSMPIQWNGSAPFYLFKICYSIFEFNFFIHCYSFLCSIWIHFFPKKFMKIGVGWGKWKEIKTLIEFDFSFSSRLRQALQLIDFYKYL